MIISDQLFWLFTLAIPIACIARTVTQEDIFSEFQEYCKRKSVEGKTLFTRKFFYLFTCDYCFSHYVTISFIILTDFKLLLNDWRGYIIAGFALVWIANLYMSVYAYIKVDIRKERIITKKEEEKLNSKE
ncbi:MAG TPA: hypothetical protein VIY47_06335 [Ignavibacteriaceae bacterium]